MGIVQEKRLKITMAASDSRAFPNTDFGPTIHPRVKGSGKQALLSVRVAGFVCPCPFVDSLDLAARLKLN